jgi:hypothetical protein
MKQIKGYFCVHSFPPSWKEMSANSGADPESPMGGGGGGGKAVGKFDHALFRNHTHLIAAKRDQ